MPNEPQPIRIRASIRFKRRLKQLAKRYRHIRSDITPLLDQLESGETPGDRIPGIDEVVYKVRVKNRDAQRGKSGGYRIIYYLETETGILLVTIYSKSDQEDISVQEIKTIIDESKDGED